MGHGEGGTPVGLAATECETRRSGISLTVLSDQVEATAKAVGVPNEKIVEWWAAARSLSPRPSLRSFLLIS
jgi:hypothetical protein